MNLSCKMFAGNARIAEIVDGVNTGFLEIGNTVSIEFTPSGETKTVPSKMIGSYGTDLCPVSLPGSTDFKISFNQMDAERLAMVFNGSSEGVTATSGSITDGDALAVFAGKAVKIPHRNISTVTFTSEAGDSAATRANTTSYDLDDYVIPATPNAHYYKATTAGTSGSSIPTWPTDGTTVTDGTVVWQDMGLIEVSTSDYIVDSTTGMIDFAADAGIVDGEAFMPSYDYVTKSGTLIKAQQKSEIRIQVIMEAVNLVDQKRGQLSVWEAVCYNTEAWDFLGEEHLVAGLSGKLITPAGKDAPYEFIEEGS